MAREEIEKGKDIRIVILMDSLNKEESMLVPTVVKTGQDHLLTYVEKTSSSLRSWADRLLECFPFLTFIFVLTITHSWPRKLSHVFVLCNSIEIQKIILDVSYLRICKVIFSSDVFCLVQLFSEISPSQKSYRRYKIVMIFSLYLENKFHILHSRNNTFLFLLF